MEQNNQSEIPTDAQTNKNGNSGDIVFKAIDGKGNETIFDPSPDIKES